MTTRPLISIVQDYLEAANRDDLEGSLAFLTDDVVLEAVGRGTVEGKSAVRSVAAWDAELRSTMQASHLSSDGEHVTCRLEERNEWLRLAGINSVRYPHCRFTIHDGLISYIRTEMDEASRQEMAAVLKEVVAWAMNERPVDLGRLLPAGEMQRGARTARGWLALLRAWRDR